MLIYNALCAYCKRFRAFCAFRGKKAQCKTAIASLGQILRHRVAVAVLLSDVVVVVLKKIDDVVGNAHRVDVRNERCAELITDARILYQFD